MQIQLRLARHSFPQALAIFVAALGLLATPASAQMMDGDGNPLAPTDESELNKTQKNLLDVAGTGCTTGTFDDDLQDRCNAIAGADDDQKVGAFEATAPEQVGAAGTEATRVSGGQLAQVNATLSGRMASLLAGSVAALETEFNGEWASLGITRSGAAGDNGPFDGRLGTFLSGTYQFGDVDNTREAVGFDFDMGGITAGADYRLTDTLVLGGAFSWMHSDADFKHSAGSSESDSYNGSIYGLYYPLPDLSFTGTATVGGIDYDLKRKIKYTAGTNNVNTKAKSDADAIHFGFAGEAAYDVHVDALTATPYFGAQYKRLEIDSYKEHGGDGWAMSFRDQNIDSVTTHLGARVNYAISTAIGIVLPQIWGEWIHEYEDDSRNIKTRLRGDPSKTPFNVETESPDRNYGVVGADLSMTFAGGISAFAAYEALVGYDDVESHQLTFGGRLEF